MKKTLALLCAGAMCLGLLAGCGDTGSSGAAGSASSGAAGSGSTGSTSTGGSGEKVDLRVVSSFSGTDGNRATYESAYQAWEQATGNTVKDESQTSDETWKAKVVADFETGSEPDVLFFFTGADANSFIEAGKVVPLETIRAEYPEYGSNMDDAKLAAAKSLVDGELYALPTTGFWEGLFVNKTVLADCGVEEPGPDTTWDEFLAMCETIKEKGYTPIACSLQQVPHYWFEFSIMNNGGPASHLQVPSSSGDAASANWAAGLNDIKELYEKGYFPRNTLSASDEETWQMMYDNKAAFAIDGSWKVGQVVTNVGDDRVDEYSVTYVPAKEARKPTDIVGGLSMGWYITQKAWDDPAKREAAVSFIEALTADDVINAMAAGTSQTALKNPGERPADLNSLQEAAFNMMNGATSVTPAVQDFIKPEAKTQILETDTKLVANGDITAEQAVENMMAANG